MRYMVRRIDLASIARLGLFLGWIIVLVPAMIVAGAGVIAIEKINEALAQVKPFSIDLLGQQLMRVDLINLLQLQPVQQTIQPWAETPWLTFLTLTLGLLLVGGFLWMFTGLMAGMLYNIIARLGLGLMVDMVEVGRLVPRRENPSH
ncbi:MAG: hypothetical protein HZB51_05595 [Chloroflexi bacterium]|nr:hypothetical protein [Chloroflexota bacterium]